MKSRSSRFSVDNLFILGAGASYAATNPAKNKFYDIPPRVQTPLDRHFTKIIDNYIDDYALTSARKKVLIKEIADRTIKSWRDPKDFKRFALEEALLIMSADIDFFSNINKPSGSRGSDVIKPYKSFESFVSNLAYLITHHLSFAKEGQDKLYSKLAEKYFPNVRTKNRIITFNYDTVLDNVLLNNPHPMPAQKLYFSEIKSDSKALEIKYIDDNPLLLKLHGSINWSCTKEDLEKIISPAIIGDNVKRIHSISNIKYEENANYEIENEKGRVPCIIPPVAVKPITSIEQFRKLWEFATEYLSMCKHLYVCGYSLPSTDILAQSLFKNIDNRNLQTITVIDPNPYIFEKWVDILGKSRLGQKNNPPELRYFQGLKEFIG